MNKKIYFLIVGLLLMTGCGEIKVDTTKPNIDNKDNLIVEDGNIINISEKIKEDKYCENYKITGANLITEDEVTTFKFKIKNNSNSEIKGGLVEIVFLNKNNEELNKFLTVTYIPTLKADDETDIQIVIARDMSNVYDFYVKMK